MSHQRPTRLMQALVAGLVGILAAGAAGCGGQAAQSNSAQNATTTAQAADKPPLPVPSPGELNAGFALALDARTPAKMRAGAIEGADIDPGLPDELAQAAKDNGVQMTVTKVQYVGDGKLIALADLTVNGKPIQGQSEIPFVASGGRWRLEKVWACQMIANASIQSRACSS